MGKKKKIFTGKIQRKQKSYDDDDTHQSVKSMWECRYIVQGSLKE